jgi:hypothetical protein
MAHALPTHVLLLSIVCASHFLSQFLILFYYHNFSVD